MKLMMSTVYELHVAEPASEPTTMSRQEGSSTTCSSTSRTRRRSSSRAGVVRGSMWVMSRRSLAIITGLASIVGCGKTSAPTPRVDEAEQAGIPASVPATKTPEPSVEAPAGDRGVIEVDAVRLYLPDELMARRVGDVGPLAAYIKEIERSTGAFLQGIDRTSAKGLFIAVGIKPGGKSRAWCEAIEGTIPDARLEELAQVIGNIPAVEVKEGAVAFAIALNLWGRTPDAFPEIPGAWSRAAKGSNEPLSIPDGVFAVVWPD